MFASYVLGRLQAAAHEEHGWRPPAHSTKPAYLAPSQRADPTEQALLLTAHGKPPHDI